MANRKTILAAASILLLGAAGGIARRVARAASEGEGEAEDTGAHVRCATRLSGALLGQAASADLLALDDPQSQVDAMLADPVFHERFATFVNRQLNTDRGEKPSEDASYYLSKEILAQGLPWSDLFRGRYRVEGVTDADGVKTAQVVSDDEGLGYFRSPAWMMRYAGSEGEGYRLVAAYRIMQNTIGLELTAVVASPDIDPSADGRMAGECRGCHYEGPFALDRVAKVLSRRVGEGDSMTFSAPDEGPQTLFDDQTIADDAELVDALVSSVDFRFRSCRLAFQYLYGRSENQCEAELFDECVDAFESAGTMQSALRVIAMDPGFCE